MLFCACKPSQAVNKGTKVSDTVSSDLPVVQQRTKEENKDMGTGMFGNVLR